MKIYFTNKLFLIELFLSTLLVIVLIMLPLFSFSTQIDDSEPNDDQLILEIDETLIQDLILSNFGSGYSAIKKATSSIEEIRNFVQEGNYEQALTLISDLSEREKQKTEVISLEISALIGKGDYDSAMDLYMLFKESDLALSKQFSDIADELIKKNKPFPAMLVCQGGLMRDVSSAKLLYQMGYSYDMLKKTYVALPYYKGAKLTDMSSHELSRLTDIDLVLANAYYKTNDYVNAKKALDQRKSEHDPSGIPAIINAKYQVSKGNYSEALELLNKNMSSSRELETKIVKAQILILKGEEREALALLATLEYSPGNKQISNVVDVSKSLALLVNGEGEESIKVLKSLDYSNEVLNIRMLLATSYLSMGDTEKAIEELKIAPFPYNELANYPEAKKILDEAKYDTDTNLAYFCLNQKFYSLAIDFCNKTIKKNGNNIISDFILVEAYLNTKEYSKASQVLLRLKNVFSGSYSIEFFLSQIYTKAGMYDEAQESYKILIEKRPDFVMADIAYGNMLSKQSKWKEAREVFEHALNFLPNSPKLLVSLGWCLAQLEELERLDALLELIDTNEKVLPANKLHLRGWLYYLRSDYMKAYELLKEAIETAPGDPEIAFHLGLTMTQLAGMKKEADNLLQQSLLFDEQRSKYRSIVNVK